MNPVNNTPGNVGIIIQARMGSQRLPGKVLRKLPDGNSLLRWVVERSNRAKGVQTVIVATSVNSHDDQIECFCRQNRINCFRGPEENVLKRYIDCARSFNLDTVVRVTADCPFIDPSVLERAINLFFKAECDYLHNSRSKKTFPRGLDVEVMKMQALEKVYHAASKPHELEHVTIFFYENPSLFNICEMTAEKEFLGPDFRLTVDTEEDFQLVAAIVEQFSACGFDIPVPKILEFLKSSPDITAINGHIQQKPIQGKII